MCQFLVQMKSTYIIIMPGSFVRYAVTSADMADKTEEDATEGVGPLEASSLHELDKPRLDEQLVLLPSSSQSSGQGARG